MNFLPKKLLINLPALSIKGVLIACSLFTPIALAACNSNAIPSSNFTIYNDGTVTHKTTGLMWKVCSEGQTWVSGSCSGSPATHSWDSALQIAETLNSTSGFPSSGSSENYTNWRLPNLKELKSIVELQCYSPAINEAIFPNTASFFYWSSSSVAVSSKVAWGVNFGNSHSYLGNSNDNNRVRLVRSGL